MRAACSSATAHSAGARQALVVCGPRCKPKLILILILIPASAMHRLVGKTIAIVGVGGTQKLRHYHSLREWGLRTILVCGAHDARPAAGEADVVIELPDMHEHARDEALAEAILASLRDRAINVDGVLTLWEDCGPLASLVAAGLGLPGIEPRAAAIAKSKHHTQQVLADRELSGNGVRLHTETRRLATDGDISAALGAVGLPAIVKLEHGSSAAAVIEVRDGKAARRALAAIRSMLTDEDDWPGIGLGFGTHVVVSELLVGTEHDVDIVRWNGATHAAFVTDNGPTRPSSFAETTALMPSQAETPKSERLVAAAEEACRRIGLESGVFNIEFIDTPHGPRVIDVNARMGGFYIRDWVHTLWKYDLLLAAVSCSLGLEPPLLTQRTAPAVAVGVMLSPATHDAWLKSPTNQDVLRVLGTGGGAIMVRFEDEVHTHELIDEPWGNLAIVRDSPAEAVDHMIELLKQVGLVAVDPDLEDQLKALLYR